jgi:hypothetical protein
MNKCDITTCFNKATVTFEVDNYHKYNVCSDCYKNITGDDK